MMPTRALPASKTVSSNRQKRLICASGVFATPASFRVPEEPGAGLKEVPVCASIVISESFALEFGRCRLFSDDGDRSPPAPHCGAHQRSQIRHQRIAIVLEV